MAGTVPVDKDALYSRLIRKIGYSVGLEQLVERVKMLVDLYVSKRELTPSDFTDLVEHRFGRQRNAAEHFSNFYGSLNLVRRVVREAVRARPALHRKEGHEAELTAIEPMSQLDSLAILRRLTTTDEQFITAEQVVLVQSLIEEDGDIFLNGLLFDFQPARMRVGLEAMLRAKRAVATKDFRNAGVAQLIRDVISIKGQPAKASADDKAVGRDRFGRRHEPLTSTRRTVALSASGDDSSVVVPDDYLDKTSKTRKGWAQDLGLFEAGAKTIRGTRLLESLDRRRVVSRDADSGAVMFWGFAIELERLSVEKKIALAGVNRCTAWDLLSAIGDSFLGENDASPAPDEEELLRLLKTAFEYYRENNSTKGLIRNSLPLYVAEPVVAAWCTAQRRMLPDLRGFLDQEYKREGTRRVQHVIIRGTEGGLFFMS